VPVAVDFAWIPTEKMLPAGGIMCVFSAMEEQ